ncbi:MAG: 16S rRNA (adenine(1518)-N(6)/adenine(1519)-N(6))-dimethyltransferase RsmA [Balneolaceae bacterium]|nr:16S rRNA (adenine(1518)-N(6)/adenine(1519)-N(6))-dimethyltransferase RsmA [Balneolaceae bacterium]
MTASQHPKAKKSLGQHFLTDSYVVDTIVEGVLVRSQRASHDSNVYSESNVSSDSSVSSSSLSKLSPKNEPTRRLVEIGPGKGILSKPLVALGWPTTLLEIDPRMVEILRKEVIPHAEGPIQLLEHDVLSSDWWLKERQWADHVAPESTLELVGNLPYYITSPILFAILERRTSIERATLMIQKEVADRILAPAGTKTYGILSVQCQLMASVKHLMDVPSTAFDPPPNVESSVIQCTFDKPSLPFDDAILKKIVRTAFQQRRKKLSNALSTLLDVEAREAATQQLGLSFDQRAEQWTPADYASLSEWYQKTMRS